MKSKYYSMTLCFSLVFAGAYGQKKASEVLKTGWYAVSEQKTAYKRQLERSKETFYIDPEVIVPVEQFRNTEIVSGSFGGENNPVLVIRFTLQGAERWSEATQKAIGKQMALVVDNRLVSVSKIMLQITTGVSSFSREGYTRKELEAIAGQMEAAGVWRRCFIDLPPPNTDGTMSLEKTLQNRRSRRQYQEQELTPECVSQLLWAAYGVTRPMPHAIQLNGGLRTAPSAGGLYPLEVYIAVGEVAGLSPGLYRYHPNGHKIELVVDKDIRAELCVAALGQKMVQNAPVSLIYTAVFSRTTGKYGERGRERYVCMDLGHSAQNVYLQAEAMGMGTCAIGAFGDSQLVQLLQLPREEEPLYIMPVGIPK